MPIVATHLAGKCTEHISFAAQTVPQYADLSSFYVNTTAFDLSVLSLADGEKEFGSKGHRQD